MTTAALDNDILLKGACYGLLKHMLAAIPVEANQAGYLGAAPFVLMARIGRLTLSKDRQAVRDALKSLFESAQALEPTPDETKAAAEIEYAAQSKNLQLDVGESQLCAMVISRNIPWLVTGDKRAIRALESLLAEIQSLTELSGKIICLEQLIIRGIALFGAKEIRGYVCAEPGVDRALAICFECGNTDPAQDVGVPGLQSYIADLRQAAKTLLVP